MDSFQANIGWKRLTKKENEKYRFVSSLPDTYLKIPKKIAKKFKKLKDSFFASFQAKISWKRLRKRENKNYRFVSSLPDE